MSRARYFHLSTQQLRTVSRTLQEDAVLVKITPQLRAEARRLGMTPLQLQRAILFYRIDHRAKALRKVWDRDHV